MSAQAFVTGLGMVTSLGADVETSWRRALAGESGLAPIRSFDARALPVAGAGEVPEEALSAIRERLPGKYADEGERRTLFALDAARAAMADAGLHVGDYAPERAGVVMGAGLSSYRLEDFSAWADPESGFDAARFARELDRTHPAGYFDNPPERAASIMAEWFGLAGPCGVITSACAAAAQAIGLGMRMIRRGEADIVACGGADSMIHPVGMAIFLLLGAASKSKPPVCRPFDRKRAGLAVGEGAGVVVLESGEHAEKRGATPWAVLAGYGASMDAWRVTAPHPAGRGAVRSMSEALADAGLAPGDVAYVNAHGTGTKLNDSAETRAIREVFGARADALAVSSSKSMIGHLIAACGAPEFIFTALSVARDVAHPTIGLENPDPKCDLDYVAEGAREMSVPAAITNSFGFGGQNATLLLRKAA